MRQPTAEQFLKDVANHQMTVLHSDGIYRHLHFASSQSAFNQWFDLVTWPNFLTISGDMGCWTFSRVRDMFGFFRSKGELKINASYWSEKLQNGVHGEGAKVWDDDTFKERLIARLPDYDFEGADLAGLTQALKDDVFGYDGPELMAYARDFEYRFADGRDFQFDCSEMPSGDDYCFHFLWCLYAIVWGIQQWDALPKPPSEAHISSPTGVAA